MKNLLLFLLTICAAQVAFSQSFSKAEAERKAKAGEVIVLEGGGGSYYGMELIDADLTNAVIIIKPANGTKEIYLTRCNLTGARVMMSNIGEVGHLKLIGCKWENSLLMVDAVHVSSNAYALSVTVKDSQNIKDTTFTVLSFGEPYPTPADLIFDNCSFGNNVKAVVASREGRGMLDFSGCSGKLLNVKSEFK